MKIRTLIGGIIASLGLAAAAFAQSGVHNVQARNSDNGLTANFNIPSGVTVTIKNGGAIAIDPGGIFVIPTDITGNAATATALQTARTINGVSFNGTANITVAAAAETLTGAALPALSGASLTALNATQLTSGTVPTARLYASAVGYNISGGANLDALAGLTSAANKLPYFTGSNTAALTSGGIEFDNGGANNGRLRYTGATTRMFHCAAIVSFSGGNSDTFTIMFAKNGTVVTTSTIALRKMGATGDVGSTAIHGYISLATNDYIEIFFANTTDADDPTVHSLNLFALGM